MPAKHARKGLCFLLFSLATPALFAQSDCSEISAEIERRISTGNYPEQNVMIARQIGSTAVQMCAFLDADTRASMLDGIDDVLPVEAGQQPVASPPSASRQPPDAGSPPPAAQEQLPAVLSAPPTGQSLASGRVERPEDMLRAQVSDWDIYNGNARILYLGTPALPQLGRPDWQVYVYVVEVTPEGQVTQHLVTSKQAQDNLSVALRRGHDELFFQRYIDNQGSNLERWSISDNRMLSSVPTPDPEWPDGSNWGWEPFRLATSDGNVLFIGNKADNNGTTTVAWFEATPEGNIAGRGSRSSSDERLAATGFYRTGNGGGGVLLDVTALDESGLSGAAGSELASRGLGATVFNERRALIIADDGRIETESDALSRMLLWDMASGGEPESPEALARMFENMESQAVIEHEFAADRSVEDMAVGLANAIMIKPFRSGYASLASVVADRSLQPPVHGSYVLSLDDNDVQPLAYVEPVAEALDVDFQLLGVGPENDLLLYGDYAGREDNNYVVRLDANGEVSSYVRAASTKDSTATIQGLLGDESGVWLFGVVSPTGSHQRIWFERLAF